MNCLHCGAKMDKSDIFCITCGTPVLTDDDITLMPNAETTKFVNEAQYSGPKPDADDALYTAIVPSETVIINNEAEPDSGLLLESDLQSDIKPEKKGNRKVIITLAVVFIVLLGFGIFLFLRPPGSPQNGDDREIPPTVSNGSEEQTDPGVEPTPTISQDVTSITLLLDGRVQTEFHTRVNERISLRARLDPEGAAVDITWASSDPDVLQIRREADSGDFEADIWGIAAGVADIIVTAGDYEERFIVFIDNLPMQDQLGNVIAGNDTPVWLTMTWTEGSYTGGDILLERSPDNLAWILKDAYDIREIYPVIGSDYNALTIEIQEYEGVFFLFADGTGHFRNPDGIDVGFTWEFKTTLIEPEG